MSNIHKKIRAVRELRNYTQAEVAELSYISLRTYQRIESGQTSPTVQQLELIAAALHCTLEDIYRFEIK